MSEETSNLQKLIIERRAREAKRPKPMTKELLE